MYLKIVCQHGGVAHKASDAAIGVLKYDNVKFTAPSGNLPCNFADSPEQSQLLNNPGVIRPPMLRITTTADLYINTCFS